jgi:hypothetical protein
MKVRKPHVESSGDNQETHPRIDGFLPLGELPATMLNEKPADVCTRSSQYDYDVPITHLGAPHSMQISQRR